MPAFTAVEEGSGEYQGGIYFAKSHVHARRLAANDLNDGEFGGLRVHRERGLDKYEETRIVPLWEMIDRGWWCDCSQCGIKINSDIYEDYAADDPDGRAGEEPQGTFYGRSFCSKGCENEWDRRRYVERGMAQKEYARLRGKVMLHFRDPIFAGERPPGRNSQWQSIYRSEEDRWDGYYIGWLGPDNPSFDWCNVWFKVPGAKHWALCRLHDRRGNEGVHTTISFPNGAVEEFKPYMKKHLDKVLQDA